ncbi:MAG: Arc family DNA-binding protein [Angelakisella sp.]|jgi:predicted DNA-binding protein|nr:Arc family DNA-binding protein [Angelakisella sp.]
MAGNYYAPFSVRIPEELLHKIKALAEQNKRSANKQVEYILERYIAEYEAENGPLPSWEP